MGGIGILNNPRSRRNLRHPGTADRLRRLLGDDGVVLDAGTPEALAAAVERLRALSVDVVAVNGGDRTGHVALTALWRALGPAPLPRLLPLRAGTLNTVAGAHGHRGSPERILHEVVERRRAGVPLRTVARDLLVVESDREPARLGFLFGTGAVVSFLEAWQGAGRTSPAAAAWLLARAAGSALVGGPFAASLTRRESPRVAVDGEEWPTLPWLALLAGTIPQVGLGFEALSRCDEQPGFFHAVGVHGALPSLARRLPRLWRGKPWPRRVALDTVARELVLEGEALRYTVEGDLYGPARRVRLATGPPLEVIVPPRRGRRFDPARPRG